MLILGLDLAWGERNPDGVALIDVRAQSARLRECRLVQGDDALLDWVDAQVSPSADALILVDAPLVCPNLTGSRPVDRETHRVFGRFHAGCHPANLSRCPRPIRLAAHLQERGFTLGWNLRASRRLVAEVYPHPAMIRLFELDRIVKYKRGPAAAQRQEFQRLQGLIRHCLTLRFPQLLMDEGVEDLLRAPRSKAAEDRLDAFFCALIGWHHWLYRGRKTEILGDRDTGFILVPSS